MTELLSIAALRAERALTLAQMGELVGISKSQMHEVESTGRASPRVALAIETLSEQDGRARIDAALLCEDVRRARRRLLEPGSLGLGEVDHDGGSIPGAVGAATGLNGDLSGGVEESFSDHAKERDRVACTDVAALHADRLGALPDGVGGDQ